MDQTELLRKVSTGELSPEEAGKLLNTEPKRRELYCKVSEKGAVSVYGLQRMPVTLYQEQWLRLLDYADQLRSFIAENESRLKKKER